MKINAKHVPILMGYVDGLNKLDVYKEILYPGTIKTLDPESKEKARFRRNEAIMDFCQERHLTASRVMARESESLIGRADKMMSNDNLLLVKVPADRESVSIEQGDEIEAQALMMLHQQALGCYVYAHNSRIDHGRVLFKPNKTIQTEIANVCHEAISEMEEMEEIDCGNLVERLFKKQARTGRKY